MRFKNIIGCIFLLGPCRGLQLKSVVKGQIALLLVVVINLDDGGSLEGRETGSVRKGLEAEDINWHI